MNTTFVVVPSLHSKSSSQRLRRCEIYKGRPVKLRQGAFEICAVRACVSSDGEDSNVAESKTGFRAWYARTTEKRKRAAAMLRSYGVAAVIAYGIFDFFTYGISFALALRAYIAAGKTLTRKTFPQVLALMWGINNFSRPFRIAGALAISPFIDQRIVKPAGTALSRLRKK